MLSILARFEVSVGAEKCGGASRPHTSGNLGTRKISQFRYSSPLHVRMDCISRPSKEALASFAVKTRDLRPCVEFICCRSCDTNSKGCCYPVVSRVAIRFAPIKLDSSTLWRIGGLTLPHGAQEHLTRAGHLILREVAFHGVSVACQPFCSRTQGLSRDEIKHQIYRQMCIENALVSYAH